MFIFVVDMLTFWYTYLTLFVFFLSFFFFFLFLFFFFVFKSMHDISFSEWGDYHPRKQKEFICTRKNVSFFFFFMYVINFKIYISESFIEVSLCCKMKLERISGKWNNSYSFITRNTKKRLLCCLLKLPLYLVSSSYELHNNPEKIILVQSL